MNSPVSAPQRAIIGAAGGTARLMFYTLLAITLMALDYRGRYVDQVRAVAGQVIEPIILLVDLPFSASDRVAEQWVQRSLLVGRVRDLEREVLASRARLGELDDLEFENAKLRTLLEAARRLEREYVAGEIASIDLDPFAHRVIVKRGRIHGIEVGMPVIDDRGVLGQVEQVNRSTARVILLSDPDHALPVQVLPSGERTIAYGSGSIDRLRLSDLPMNTALEVGDLVVTSGLGGQFPPGLPVGRVGGVQRLDGQPFAEAAVTPLSAMDRNRLVLIVEAVPAPTAADSQTADDDLSESNPEGGSTGDDGVDDAQDPTQLLDDEAQVDPQNDSNVDSNVDSEDDSDDNRSLETGASGVQGDPETGV